MGFTQKEYSNLAEELNQLFDTDPAAAVARARVIVDASGRDGNSMLLAAGILVDAGKTAGDLRAVEKGLECFQLLFEGFPDELSHGYNVANALMARANLQWADSMDWYVQTMEDRTTARLLYARVTTSENVDVHLRAQAHINLANTLRDAYRFSEAYDHYCLALELDPHNGVARIHAASLLLRFAKRNGPGADTMVAVAVHHLKVAKENPARIKELVSEWDFKKLAESFYHEFPTLDVPDLSDATPFQRFIAEHRLFLADSIEGLDLSLDRWDALVLDRISDGADAIKGPPPLFAMFNTLKSDYLAARHIAFQALHESVLDSGSYSDTEDLAQYGIVSALMTLAQRACLDILDKVAVLTNEYLQLAGDPNKIYFVTTWFDRTKNREISKWKDPIDHEVKRGNTALIALSELARDIQDGGYLELRRAMRHASTHRFSVLHAGLPTALRESVVIEHYAHSDFIDHLIGSLQTSRAAIHYVAEMIRQHEAIHDDGRLTVQLSIREVGRR
ncbi:LA2681 family HEPN domain-containing protein [Paraburkholderia phenoliruptrix]|uniref:LA2681 family HEPN domain-containing protein n=1 Tax=Paraburkholderia phenoliruptrix TaxID=252970 RepID=UPI002869A7B1|nr:LA2681 family HEPN domain-containing protein [Paraburkholderia phenoliruptrix]WMY11760.1 LA2681 family HEPN domain-containing protein [Paraburkholderia phenoliruptrix]